MVYIGRVPLDNGIPKICVPLVGKTIDDVIQECHYIQDKVYDIIEFRADCLQGPVQGQVVLDALRAIRDVLPTSSILFTFRTHLEGGEKEISEESYFSLITQVIQEGVADAVDVEYFRDRRSIEVVVALAKEKKVTVVMSNHDFNETPFFEEITSRLIGMKRLGADVAKLACMPQQAKDVLTLLRATEFVKAQYPDEPIITMSMGRLGVISRISGEAFGSAMTFGSAKKASAPGQLDVDTLQYILKAIHGQ